METKKVLHITKEMDLLIKPLLALQLLKKQLTGDPTLSDIDAVTLQLRNICAQQRQVMKLSTSFLTQGIASENVTQTTTALQIVINLGTIKCTINNIMDVCLYECNESLKSAFDTSGAITNTPNETQAGPGRANITSSRVFRNGIWTDLEKAFSEEIYQQSKQIKFLQRTYRVEKTCVETKQVSGTPPGGQEINISASAAQQLIV